MAIAITPVSPTTSTTDAESYVSSSFTPAADDLLFIIVKGHGTAAIATLTSSVGGKTFTLAYSRSIGTGTVYVFIADQGASNVAQTVTFDCTGDEATGCIIKPFRITEIVRTGSAALRQSVGTTRSAGSDASVTFGMAPLTGNPIILAVDMGDATAGLNAPAGFSTAEEAVTPSAPQGTLGTCYVTGGVTDTTINWGADTNGSSYQSLGFEINAAAAASLARSIIPAIIG